MKTTNDGRENLGAWCALGVAVVVASTFSLGFITGKILGNTEGSDDADDTDDGVHTDDPVDTEESENPYERQFVRLSEFQKPLDEKWMPVEARPYTVPFKVLVEGDWFFCAGRIWQKNSRSVSRGHLTHFRDKKDKRQEILTAPFHQETKVLAIQHTKPDGGLRALCGDDVANAVGASLCAMTPEAFKSHPMHTANADEATRRFLASCHTVSRGRV